MHYLLHLEKLYSQHANPSLAAPMAKYMKDKFTFFGIPSPLRKQLDKDFFAEHGKPQEEQLPQIIKEAYAKPQRELQYFAIALTNKFLKKLPEDFIHTAHFMIVTKSWWDTVDAVAADIVGTLVMKYPALSATMDDWITSDNMWLQRSAILHQLRYKNLTDEKRLFDYCRKCAASNEFFIRKAIGWALREHTKTNTDAVKKFVAITPLSNFSKKEALKRLAKQIEK